MPNKKLIIVFSVLISFLGVVIFTYGATTISTNIETEGNLTVGGDATFDTDTLYIDSTNGYVGVGTTTPRERLDVAGNITPAGA